MATSNSTQILVDTTKRTVIKRVGIFDTAGGNEALTVVIDPRTLSGALNANNLPYQTGNTVATGFANSPFCCISSNLSLACSACAGSGKTLSSIFPPISKSAPIGIISVRHGVITVVRYGEHRGQV